MGLVIGQNDVRNSEGVEDLEFVFTIDKSVEKVRQEMEREPNKSLAIFMKVDDPTAPTLSSDLARREKYLEREIGGLASDRITVTKLPTALAEAVTSHLNDQVDLIDIMDGVFTSDLIMNPAYIASGRLYAGGGGGTYRYGCRTCHKLGQFGAKLGICTNCEMGMDDYPMKVRLPTSTSRSGGGATGGGERGSGDIRRLEGEYPQEGLRGRDVWLGH